MNNDVFPCKRWDIRGTDSNSLLRLYDLATRAFHKSSSQQERLKAAKVIKRIGKELQERHVKL